MRRGSWYIENEKLSCQKRNAPGIVTRTGGDAARLRRAGRAIEPGRRGTRRGAQRFDDIILLMTKLLDEAVALLGTLPDDEQDRAAKALLAFAQERTHYALDV